MSDIPYSVADGNDVACPHCGTRSPVSATVAVEPRACDNCRGQFIVRPSASPAPTKDAPSGGGRAARLKLSKSMVINAGPKTGTIITDNAEKIDGIPCAVATATDVGCPRCGKRFKIRPEFYGAVGECKDCFCEFIVSPPAPISTVAGPQAEGRPARLKLSKSMVIDFGPKTGTILTNEAEQVDGIPCAVATATDVGCPRCGKRFKIRPEFYGAVGECKDCSCEFIVAPPSPPPVSIMGAPQAEGRPARLKLSKSMVINAGTKTGTILTNEAEEVDGIPCAVATATDVGCPRCGKRFKVRPEFYGSVGECKDCSCEFIVKPPEGAVDSAETPVRSVTSIRTEQMCAANARLRPKPQRTECMPLSRGAIADSHSGPIRCTPVEGKITCPGCDTVYPVSRKFFNTQKVCLKCRREFFITAPDTA